jgi:hypothetical protein
VLLRNSPDGSVANSCEYFAPILECRIQGCISIDRPLGQDFEVGVSCLANRDDPWSRIDDDSPPGIESNAVGSRLLGVYHSCLPLAFGRLPR